LSLLRLVLANHSSYPRVGEGASAQRLRRAYANRETGKIDENEFETIARDYVAEVIKEQEDAGLDLVTDGLVYWYDLLAHPARRLDNITINGLVRFFDTNTYVRQPEVNGKIGGTFGIADDFKKAKSQTTKELKAVIPGPYTLARHSISKSNGDLSSMAMAYAEALGRELEALNAAGATVVQIEEPSLLKFPDDAEMVRNVLKRAVESKGNLTISLATYFGDATTIYGELINMPCEILAVDLIYGPGLFETIVQHGSDRPIALGVVDARNTKLDDAKEVAAKVGRVVDALDAKGVSEVHLQPSNGLEFLPRDRAKRKLERLAEIRDAVAKAGA
jgi:5-methyltetrahydropteroyltriglutamate--homocysteine methyltransferase